MRAVEATIESIPVDTLRAAARNARTHSEKQIDQIAKSIKRFGFTNPVLIDDEKSIIAGHGRVAAAKALGMTEVPCLRLSAMSTDEKRAYLIADNRLAEAAGWDRELLALELQDLIDIDFDVSVTGFDQTEIDAVLSEQADASLEGAPEPADDIPPISEGRPVTQLGDIWRLGRHLLICGDTRDRSVFDRLLQEDRADMVFTDPPYNVPIQGHVSGLGSVQHREFAAASGEMSEAAFTHFLTCTLSNASATCRDGAIAFVCIDWRHLAEMDRAGRAAFSELKNLCVWTKTNGGMGTFYRSKHELVFAWKVGTAPHVNNFGLGDKGRYRTNVWSYPGVNTFKSDRMDELASHPTVKPVALVADAIRDVSHRGSVVLDPFGGSGTTLIAAQMTGRIGRLIEIDPLYCDVIIRRFEKFTGKSAVHTQAGGTFEQLSVIRDRQQLSRAVWANKEPEARIAVADGVRNG